MKTKIVELRQKRAQLIAEARQMLEAHPEGFDQEQENRYDTLVAEQDKLLAQAERLERQAQAEASLDESVSDTRERRPQTRRQEAEAENDPRASEEYRRAYEGFLRYGEREMPMSQRAILQADNDAGGGYLTAPLEMQRQILQEVDDLVFIRRAATVFQTPTADGLGVPKLENDPEDAEWTSELRTGSEDTAMSFGGRELHPHPMAKRIRISRTLIRRLPGIEAFVRQRLAYKFAITQEKAFLLGNGAQQPLGIFTPSALGISTGRDVSADNTQTAITFDGLINAKYSLKGQYWNRVNWMFHRDALKQIAKIKNAVDGGYVWQPSVQAGQPDLILGRPLQMSEYVPNTFTAGKYVGALGDFSYYWINDALTMDVQRLEELYAETNQIGLIARLESDGMPVLEEAFARIKLA